MLWVDMGRCQKEDISASGTPAPQVAKVAIKKGTKYEISNSGILEILGLAVLS